MDNKNTVEIVSGKGPKFKVLGRYYRYVEPVIRDPLIRGYFEIVATVLFIAFCLFFFIRPTSTTIVQLYRQVEDKTKEETDLQQKINDLVAAEANYSAAASKIDFLNQSLPYLPNVDKLTEDLETICKDNKVDPLNLTVGGTGLTADAWKDNKGFKDGQKVPLTFSFSAKTDFATAEKLLESLTSYKRLIKVKAISFTNNPDSTKELTINYTGEAYFLP